MPTLNTLLPKTLTASLAALSAPLAWAHPGHRHLDGAPGDMHLHDLLPDSLWGGLVLITIIAVAVVGAVQWVRRSRR